MHVRSTREADRHHTTPAEQMLVPAAITRGLFVARGRHARSAFTVSLTLAATHQPS